VERESPNNEKSQDYLCSRIAKLTSEYKNQKVVRDTRLANALQDGVQAIASFAANETELHRQFKSAYEVLIEEIESLEEAIVAGTQTESCVDRLAMYRDVKISLSETLLELTKEMYQSRFEYMQLKSKKMSEPELVDEVALWSERAIHIEKYGPEMRAYTLKCKELCETELANRKG
jgi:hypothetical protein